MKKTLLAVAAAGALTALTATSAMAFENEFHGMYRFAGFYGNFFEGTTFSPSQAAAALDGKTNDGSGFFAEQLDFLSIGTNDLIQYTLAIDRADDSVAHLYDPLHPAVLNLIQYTLRAGAKAGKPVSVCGEMAGDPLLTRLLLGLGLRTFSMQPASLLQVKQQVLKAHLEELVPAAQRLLKNTDPDRTALLLDRLNG
jgi:hypothetical protein